jgi:hypothetical protein
MDLVGFNLHAAAAAVALLTAPEIAVDEFEIDGDTGGQSGDEGDKGFPMGFAGG